jgi:hypothetical protein
MSSRYVGTLIVAALFSLPVVAFGQAQPLPVLQLDFPVLAPGEEGTMRLQIPPDNGMHNGIHYYLYAVEQVEGGVDSGYRFSYPRCPPGFRRFNFLDGEFVSCYFPVGRAPHPAGEMIVNVKNVNAPAGELVMRNGILATYSFVPGGTWSPWRAYGVK